MTLFNRTPGAITLNHANAKPVARKALRKAGKATTKTFEVTGDFNALAFIRTLHDNGLHAFVK